MHCFLLLSLLLLLLLFVFEVVTCFLLINYAVALAGCKSFDNTQLATRATATGNSNGKCQKQTSESGDPQLDLPYPPVYVNEMSVENEKFLFIINRMQFLWPIVRRVARLADCRGDEVGVRRT